MGDLNINQEVGGGVIYNPDLSVPVAPPPPLKTKPGISDEISPSIEIGLGAKVPIITGFPVPSLSPLPKETPQPTHLLQMKEPEVLNGTSALLNNKETNQIIKQYGGNYSLVEYQKVISKAIHDLEQELFRADQQKSIDESGGLSLTGDTPLDLSPFASAYLEASKLNPKLADLMLIKGRLETIKEVAGNKTPDGSGIDLSNFPELVSALKEIGVFRGTDTILSNAEVSSAIGTITSRINAEVSKSAINSSLQSVLNTAINGVLPMLATSSTAFELMRVRSHLLEWGFKGEPGTWAADRQILDQHPELVKQLARLGILNAFATAITNQDIPNLMNKIDAMVQGQIKSAPITAKQLVMINSRQMSAVGFDAAKNFLEMMEPIQDVLRNYVHDQSTKIANESNLPPSTKKGLVDMVNTSAATNLLAGALSRNSNSSVENFSSASTLLSDVNASRDLVKAFFDAGDWKRQHDAWVNRDLPMIHKYDLVPTSKYLGMRLENLNQFVKSRTVGFGSRFDYFIAMEALKNLTVQDARLIPLVFRYLREHPELRNHIKNYDAILAEDVMIKQPPGEFKSFHTTQVNVLSAEQATAIDEENIEALSTMLKMLKKLLASLNDGGQISTDVDKANKKIKEKLGIAFDGSNDFSSISI